MGKAQGTHLLSGRLLDMIFKVRNGKQYVSMAPFKSDHKRRMEHPEKYSTYSMNLSEFAGASKIAKEFYRELRNGFIDDDGAIVKPYAFNAIVAAIKKSGDHVNQHTPGSGLNFGKYTILDGVKGLTGLDISHPDAPTSNIKMRPIGPQHNPDAIHITGLEHAAAAIKTHGNARLEFRFRIAQSRFQEMAIDETGKKWITAEQANGLPALDPMEQRYRGKPSGWIPTEIIPAEGFTLPLPERPENEKYATAIVIEWREHRPVGRKLIHHRRKAIVRIACVHGPSAAWPTPSHSQSSRAKPRTLSNCLPKHALLAQTPTSYANCYPLIVVPQRLRWEDNPKAYLDLALQRMRT